MKFEYKDQIKFEKLFDMPGGHVLDFSIEKLRNFVVSSIGIDIYEGEEYEKRSSGSKANRLRCLWDIGPSDLIGKLLLDLLEYRRVNYPDEDLGYLYNQAYEIAENLRKSIPSNDMPYIAKILEINHDYIQENIKKCDKKMTEGDYSGAITNARSLIESVLLYTGEKRGVIEKGSKYDGKLNPLHKRVTAALNLSMVKISNDVISFGKIISGLHSIIAGIAELSGDIGDRHGKGSSDISYVIEYHHAALCVNSAKIYSTFILDVHNKLENTDLIF